MTRIGAFRLVTFAASVLVVVVVLHVVATVIASAIR